MLFRSLRQRRYLEEDQPERSWAGRESARQRDDERADWGRAEGGRQAWSQRQERWAEEESGYPEGRGRDPGRGERPAPLSGSERNERARAREDDPGGWPEERFAADDDRPSWRRPQGLERDLEPELPRRSREPGRGNERNDGRPPTRSAGPSGGRLGEQPVDVEPEVLDDPW